MVLGAPLDENSRGETLQLVEMIWRDPPALEMKSTAGRFNWFEHADALWRRVPATVVDCHRPRFGQTGDRSAQGTADSLIQVDENRLIEWPYVPCGKAVGGSCEEWLGWVIHKELDLVCRPNDPVGVESCVHCLSAGEKEEVRKPVP